MNGPTETCLLDGLRCVECRSGALSIESGLYRCQSCGSVFPMYHGKPVLIGSSNRTFPIEQFGTSTPRRPLSKTLARYVPRPSVNLARRSAMLWLAEALNGKAAPMLLVVGAGRQRARITKMLRPAVGAAIYCCDVDIRSDVDVFCDAHDLPFRNGMFDCIITTAVLQFVADPSLVASEIVRLLRPGGFIYSEISLLQHVTEGPYDFHRFTLSGHKLLFRDLQEVRSGLVAGPATVLVWAIEQTAVCLIRSTRMHPFVRAAVRICFFWLKYLDYSIKHNPASLDGASCTYLMARKPTGVSSVPVGLEDLYVGSRSLSHIR